MFAWLDVECGDRVELLHEHPRLVLARLACLAEGNPRPRSAVGSEGYVASWQLLPSAPPREPLLEESAALHVLCRRPPDRWALSARLVLGDAEECPEERPVESQVENTSLPGRRTALDLNAMDVAGLRKPVGRKQARNDDNDSSGSEYVPSESSGSEDESTRPAPARPTVVADARYRRFAKSIVKMGSYNLRESCREDCKVASMALHGGLDDAFELARQEGIHLSEAQSVQPETLDLQGYGHLEKYRDDDQITLIQAREQNTELTSAAYAALTEGANVRAVRRAFRVLRDGHVGEVADPTDTDTDAAAIVANLRKLWQQCEEIDEDLRRLRKHPLHPGPGHVGFSTFRAGHEVWGPAFLTTMIRKTFPAFTDAFMTSLATCSAGFQSLNYSLFRHVLSAWRRLVVFDLGCREADTETELAALSPTFELFALGMRVGIAPPVMLYDAARGCQPAQFMAAMKLSWESSLQIGRAHV